MTATITFSWPEKNIEQEYEILRFRQTFSDQIGNCPLLSAELDPPAKLRGRAGTETIVSKIHFTDFTFTNGEFSVYFSADNYSIRLWDNIQNLKLKIIPPGLFHNPIQLSKKLKDVTTEIRAHLFYKDRGSETLEHLASIVATWATLDKAIKDQLVLKRRGKYGVSVQILGAKEPLNSADVFIDPKFSREFMRNVMCITVSSSSVPIFYYDDKELLVNSVPPIPCSIIQRCSDIIISRKGSNAEILCRRIVAACFNSALPLNLFDYLNIEMDGLEPGWNFTAKNFERVAIQLERDSNENISAIENDLKIPLINIKHFLFQNLSEFEIRVFFWEPILNLMFHRSFNYEPPYFHYRPSSEWETESICPGGKPRRVDFAILMKIRGIERPVLLCEIGKGDFGFGVNSHKDFSKMLTMLSLACRKMAKELELDGRKAEDARVFGKWVGRTQVQFCVAHPVVIKRIGGEVNSYTLHVHVTFPDEWKFDVISRSNTYIDSEYNHVGADLSNHGLRDALIAADPEVDTGYTSPVSPIYLNAEAIVMKSDHKNETETRESAVPIEKLFVEGRNEIDLRAFSKIDQFYKVIFARISYLNSSASLRPQLSLPRDFYDGDSPEFIVSSRPSATDISPMSERVGENRREPPPVPNSPSVRAQKPKKRKRSLKTHEIEIYKKSAREFSIYQEHLCKFDKFFPKVYHMEKVRKDLNLYRYVFERMLPMKTVKNVLVHTEFDLNLLDAAEFTLAILNCLHILHDKLKFVHSDISPPNIMYCNYNEIWKLNDYDHCLPIEESLATKRTAGTPGFTAHESLQTGIFTPASDIWSLGRIITDIAIAPLMTAMEWSRIHISPEHAACYYEFESIVFEMTMLDATRRPTAKAALKRTFQLIVKLKNDFDPKFPIYSRMTRLFPNLEGPSNSTILS